MNADERRQLEEQLSAYLDGELTEPERARIEAFLAENAEARRLLEELAATVAGLKALPRARASEEFSQNLRARLERRALLAGGPSAQTVPPPLPSRFGRWITAAAVLALAFVGTFVTWSVSRQEPDTPRPRLVRQVAHEGETSESPGRLSAGSEQTHGTREAGDKPPLWTFAKRREPDGTRDTPGPESSRAPGVPAVSQPAALPSGGDVIASIPPESQPRSARLARGPVGDGLSARGRSMETHPTKPAPLAEARTTQHSPVASHPVPKGTSAFAVVMKELSKMAASAPTSPTANRPAAIGAGANRDAIQPVTSSTAPAQTRPSTQPAISSAQPAATQPEVTATHPAPSP